MVEATLDRREGAAHLLDLVEVRQDLALHVGRQALDEPRAAQRVDRVHDAALVEDHLLGADGERRGLVAWDRLEVRTPHGDPVGTEGRIVRPQVATGVLVGRELLHARTVSHRRTIPA